MTVASVVFSATLSSNTDDAGIILNKGAYVTYFGFKLKSDVADGTYPVKWDKNETKAILDPGSYGADNPRPLKYAEIDLVDGAIVVGDGTAPVVTATPSTPSTDKLQW